MHQIKKTVLGQVFKDKVMSKIGVNTKHQYNHLRGNDGHYIKPDTPEEYIKVKYKDGKKADPNDSSITSSSAPEEDTPEDPKTPAKQDTKKQEEAKTERKKVIRKPKKITQKDAFTYEIKRPENKTTKRYKFSSSEREPTFLYTSNPYTKTNEQIQTEKKKKRIIEEVEKSIAEQELLENKQFEQDQLRLKSMMNHPFADQKQIQSIKIEKPKKKSNQKKEMLKLKTEELINKQIHICNRFKQHIHKSSKKRNEVRKLLNDSTNSKSLNKSLQRSKSKKRSKNRSLITIENPLNIRKESVPTLQDSCLGDLRTRNDDSSISKNNSQNEHTSKLPELNFTNSPNGRDRLTNSKICNSILPNTLPHHRLIRDPKLDTLGPFQSFVKNSGREVAEELFKQKHFSNSTIANSKFPSFSFAKQTSRKSLVNLKQNPHESRFNNIDRFPSILSSNKKTNSIVSWDKSKKSISNRRKFISNEWNKKKSYIHKYKKKDLLKQNECDLGSFYLE
ncbi:unnamed protein product [Moneuplotes crassus]|uniref:Uncharacterized protein n=1 Tax=Euplotes crassus TaxID=5936 RepID=A0AAD1YA74_EUPCR|nr:unnamed protein product [Moneuplotes crassus]